MDICRLQFAIGRCVWMLRLLAQSARSGGIKPEKRKITVVNPDQNVRERFSLLFPNAEFRGERFDTWLSDCLRRDELV